MLFCHVNRFNYYWEGIYVPLAMSDEHWLLIMGHVDWNYSNDMYVTHHTSNCSDEKAREENGILAQ
jgi:hypothetical protein